MASNAPTHPAAIRGQLPDGTPLPDDGPRPLTSHLRISVALEMSSGAEMPDTPASLSVESGRTRAASARRASNATHSRMRELGDWPGRRNAHCGRHGWAARLGGIGPDRRDGGDGGESNSPSRTELPGTCYRCIRPTCASLSGPRPAGCSVRYPVLPLGSLTSRTGVGGAAPPLMTSWPSGEGGRPRRSLTTQREQLDDCQLLACPRFNEAMRATSTCSSRFLSPVET